MLILYVNVLVDAKFQNSSIDYLPKAVKPAFDLLFRVFPAYSIECSSFNAFPLVNGKFPKPGVGSSNLFGGTIHAKQPFDCLACVI